MQLKSFAIKPDHRWAVRPTEKPAVGGLYGTARRTGERRGLGMWIETLRMQRTRASQPGASPSHPPLLPPQPAEQDEEEQVGAVMLGWRCPMTS